MNEITFSFSKSKLTALIAVAFVTMVLVFATGFVSAMVWAGAAASMPVPVASAVPKLPENSPKAAAQPATVATSGPAPVPATPAPPPPAPQPMTNRAEAASPEPATLLPPEKTSVRLTVLAASFRDPDNADRLVTRLTDMGFVPERREISGGDQQVWYRVRVGPYADWDSASETASRIRESLNVNPVISLY